MILTGKAKEDFSKFYIDNNYDLTINFKNLPEIYQNALIIGWFDSVGNLNNKGCVYNFKTLYLSTFKQLEKHHSILDIQKTTIKKANEIYNMESTKEEPKQKWNINTCRYFNIEVGCEREECICVNNPYEEPKQDIIMELEKDTSLKEFDNRVSKNLNILKNKKETLTNDTDSHSWGFENFEVIKTEEDAKIFVETMENIPEPNDKLKKAFRGFNKQETLEEAKVNNLINLFGKDYDLEPRCVIESCNDSLIYGANWQQDKNKYSEEEVLEIIDSLFNQYASSFRIDAKEYFLLFKKK